MADLLQTQFTSVFSDPNDPKAKTPKLHPQFAQPLIDFTFNPADIMKAIKQIDKNALCGEKDINTKTKQLTQSKHLS